MRTLEGPSDTHRTAPHTGTGPSVFEAKDLTKVYHMGEVEVHALRGVDVSLFESEFLVLLGPSGSGKSTLLNILGGWMCRPRVVSCIAAKTSRWRTTTR